jgi:glycosyltransferase involved in cell wall biosynthesis
VKVLVVAACPYPAPFGTQVLTKEICESLSDRGHDVHLVTYPVGAGKPASPGYTIHRCSTLPGYSKLTPGPSAGKALLDWFLYVKLLRTARNLKPDIIHAHNYEAGILSVWAGRRSGVPVVYHMHGLLAEELPYYWRLSRTIRPFAKSIDRYLLRNADHVICNSDEESRGVTDRGANAGTLAVVRPSVDLSLFEDVGKSRAAGQPVVFYSGNLDSYQGVEHLIGAFSKVARYMSNLTLRIVTISAINKAKSVAEKMGLSPRVEFVRPRNFAAEVEMLRDAWVCVCPRTLASGYPMKVLNYMAASRPVVVSESAARGLTHLEHAWVAKDGDENQLAEGIVALITDRGLADKVSRQARLLVETVHSRNVMAERIEELYEELLAS